jgi:hypothetical protein
MAPPGVITPGGMLREQHVAGDIDRESLSPRFKPSVWLGGKRGVIPTFSPPSRSTRRAPGKMTILDQVTEEPIDFMLSKPFRARRGRVATRECASSPAQYLFRWLCNLPT